MSVLFYKRPDYVSKENGPMSSSSCKKYANKVAGTKYAIPPQLSFENVVEGRTLPPTSVQDFLDYLSFISLDPENLQFYLWLQDYEKRFDALPPSEKALSPAWTVSEGPPDLSGKSTTREEEESPKLAADMSGMSFYDDSSMPTTRPPSPPPKDRRHVAKKVAKANAQAGLKWQSFSIQPFRREISVMISHYVAPQAPRELNLSHRTRSNILHALQHTTHPSALAPLKELTALTLRNQSHPNFIRWSICNGNRPRVIFLRSLAIFSLLAATAFMLALILSHYSRWIRLAAAPVVWFACANLVAASKGLCVLLYRRNTREARPWELLDEDDPRAPLNPQRGWLGYNGSVQLLRLGEGKGQLPTSAITDVDPEKGLSSVSSSFSPKSPAGSTSSSLASSASLAQRLAPFGPANKEFQAEPWMERWSKRSWWGKLRLKKLKIGEEGLRIMQHKIVVQAEIWATIITTVVMAGVVACPQVGLY